ncbi:MAG TPA: alkaline phosphatase family protein, partial [Actinomycetota bacterium]
MAFWVTAAVVLGGTVPLVTAFVEYFKGPPAPPSFDAQACALPPEWLTRIKRGYYEPRSGQISIVPRYPMYMASGAGGWSHSGPWPYLQRIPMVFYGPGIVPGYAHVGVSVTMADVAATLASLMHTDERVRGNAMPGLRRHAQRPIPKLVLTIVWDGGGSNVLDHWKDAWPNLERFMAKGASYDGWVGSSPSVTPAVHTTLGTGHFPSRAGVTDVPVLDEK